MELLLGLVGPAAAGKSTFAEMLEKTGVYRFGRITLSKDHPLDRGGIEEKIREMSEEIVILDCVRRFGDLEILHVIRPSMLICVMADPLVRWRRSIKELRKEQKPYPAFEEFCKKEWGEGAGELFDICRSAQIQIQNNGDLEDLRRNLDVFILTI